MRGYNLKLIDNIAMIDGGAINVLQDSHLNFTKVQFIGNQAYEASVVNIYGS